MTEEDASAASPSANEPVSTLRGASPAVDARRVAQVAVVVIMATLAVLGIVFIAVGINKNDQINELRSQGVRTIFVVSRCIGQLGGSGSNVAGYSCQGSYKVVGHRYTGTLPGSTYYAPGTLVVAVAASSDPTLLSTPAIVGSEQASASVFILPIVLLGLFVLLLAVVLLRRRRAGAPASAG